MTGRPYGISRAHAMVLAVAFLGAGSAPVGCTAGREGARPAVGIAGADFRSGGMAIGGVTMKDEVEQIRPPLIAALERTLTAERPDLPFRRADTVREALGVSAYRRLMMAYQTDGGLEDKELEEFKTALGPSTRFLILGRVEKSTTRESSRPVSRVSAEFPQPSTWGRDARIRFTLYDLSTDRAAFEEMYASSSKNVPPDSAFFAKRAGRGEPREVASEVRIPDLDVTLLEAFKAFAADLPR